MKAVKWNDDWKFWKDTDSFALVWNIPEQARTVRLPHDAMIEEKADPKSPNGTSTGFRDGGSYIYVKQFDTQRAWEAQRVAVFFEGVYRHARVYLNGQFVAANDNGYTGFCAELTDYLNAEGANELRVQVKTGAMRESRWYSGSGIYRDVYLLTSNQTHIAHEGVRVRTERLEASLAVLLAETELWNRSGGARELTLVSEIRSEAGGIAARETSRLFLKAGEKRTVRQRMLIENPEPWGEDRPVLYRMASRLTDGGQLLDEQEIEFGIRTFSVDSRKGLLVNGANVTLRGACIHHDSGLLGAATYEAAQLRQVRLLKEAGFNAIRMSHHPMAPAMLRACDRLGVYVMDELSDMWLRAKSDHDYSLDFESHWREDAQAMVRKDFNHPSVLLYSIGNEIPEIGMKQGSSLAHQISEYIRGLDGTRCTTAGINGVFACGDLVPAIMADLTRKTAGERGGGADGKADGNVNDFMTVMDTRMDDIVTHAAVSGRLDMAAEALDVMGYNYMTARYERDAAAYPHRVMVGAETYPPEIARNWEIIERTPAVIGDFTWTGWDYIGEAGIGIPGYQPGEGGFGAQYPVQLSGCGDLDLTGFRRPASYYRESVFGRRTAPYIAVQDPAHHGEKLIRTPWVISDAIHSWTWPGREGEPVTIEVYGRGYEAELLVNGVSQGRKRLPRPGAGVIGYRVLFEAAYQKGCVTAILYDERGQEIGRDVLEYRGEAASLALSAEDCGDLLYISAVLTDANGKEEDGPAYDQELRVETAENLTVLGFGSADPRPLHNYNEGVSGTWNGRALLIAEKRDQTLPGRLFLRSEKGCAGGLTL
ncbi:glycoside hydrolase family 2 TIM barrel-domain containing protein [Lachnoclostridium sp. Marseille-P6806]|uniref:glycoside hydrolase family 2 TIM barrel-domain containing protein n=1 Tax=Lachnoclostridium sp. Marseille-P6806 TaxID=2364793 RepID=UPI001031AFFF|nr:glycoside hydrolase family 2 TIM barrel-domain containing protein [Lachnoclostridium sp. Marseille-P6806]